MKRLTIVTFSLGALAASAMAQTTSITTGFAPTNFGNTILTSTPSNATGASGISTVYTSDGSQFTFGTGGALVNPMQFDYVVTGPNTATLTYPATETAPESTTKLVFTSATAGTYATTAGSETTTGQFRLADIPGAAPLANVSSRSTLPSGGSSIVGFVIAGAMPRRVLIRAVGPALRAFGVANVLERPSLRLYSGRQLIASNTAWGTMQTLAASTGPTVGNGGLSSGTSSSGTSSGTGTTTTSSGTTSGGTSSGSTATGTTSSGSATVGDSAVATGTTTNGVFTGTLANGSSFTTELATADDFASVGAFGLTEGSNDAALVATLPPGAYSVVVSANTAVTLSGTTRSGTGGASGTVIAGTAGGASTGTNSSGVIGTGSTSGGVAGGASTTGAGGTSTGTTSGGLTSGTGTSTATGSTGVIGGTSGTGTTGSTTTSTGGDVLVEVYFLE